VCVHGFMLLAELEWQNLYTILSVFPYSPTLLPSSRNALYLLLIYTFPLESTVTDVVLTHQWAVLTYRSEHNALLDTDPCLSNTLLYR